MLDIEIRLSSAFDRNFERKAFFDRRWPARQVPGRRGSLLINSGSLRRSIHSHVLHDKIRWVSYLPYAKIHNDGGEIRVTPRMKRFFWAKWYETSRKQKNARREQKNRVNGNVLASFYKAMALKPVGSTVKMPRRRFIGNHPQVHRIIRQSFDRNLKEIEYYIKNQFKKPGK